MFKQICSGNDKPILNTSHDHGYSTWNESILQHFRPSSEDGFVYLPTMATKQHFTNAVVQKKSRVNLAPKLGQVGALSLVSNWFVVSYYFVVICGLTCATSVHVCHVVSWICSVFNSLHRLPKRGASPQNILQTAPWSVGPAPVFADTYWAGHIGVH